MANLVNKDYVRSVMEPAIELLQPNAFVLNHLFKSTEAYATREVDLDLYRGKRRVPAYVVRGGSGQNVDKIGYDTKAITPPYLMPKKTILPGDAMKRLPGESVGFQGSSRTAQFDAFLARELNDLDALITRAEILQANQALWDGEVLAKDDNGNNVYKLDFQRAANLTYQVGTLWSAGGANPLKDLKEARRRIQTHTGFRADFIYGGFDAIETFLNSTAVQNQISQDWSGRGRLMEELMDNGGVWYGRVAGFDVWGWDETYLDANGDSQYFFPEKKVLVGSTQARATKLYGAVEVQGMVQATPRYLNVYTQENDNGAVITQLHSAPVMITNHPDAYAVLTVLT